ncbi:PREDICTED: translation initiation factor IF-2-like [Chinchilla lanigera]|uniref:translation initiation factor IF-2-like n=1 Tax=Chinchilla lanigera TaxID=34839 RepID=UPI0006985F8D|nr:PREDICTED: translation initiation factor IF-2-like [Chinchilla lanigera]
MVSLSREQGLKRLLLTQPYGLNLTVRPGRRTPAPRGSGCAGNSERPGAGRSPRSLGLHRRDFSKTKGVLGRGFRLGFCSPLGRDGHPRGPGDGARARGGRAEAALPGAPEPSPRVVPAGAAGRRSESSWPRAPTGFALEHPKCPGVMKKFAGSWVPPRGLPPEWPQARGQVQMPPLLLGLSFHHHSSLSPAGRTAPWT